MAWNGLWGWKNQLDTYYFYGNGLSLVLLCPNWCKISSEKKCRAQWCNLIASASPAPGGALVSSKTCKRAGADSGMPRLMWLVCSIGVRGLITQASWKLNEQLMITWHAENIACLFLPKVALWGRKWSSDSVHSLTPLRTILWTRRIMEGRLFTEALAAAEPFSSTIRITLCVCVLFWNKSILCEGIRLQRTVCLIALLE